MEQELFEKCRYLTAADWYELSKSLNMSYPYTLLEKYKMIMVRDNK